jgi:hypothetical protein
MTANISCLTPIKHKKKFSQKRITTLTWLTLYPYSVCTQFSIGLISYLKWISHWNKEHTSNSAASQLLLSLQTCGISLPKHNCSVTLIPVYNASSWSAIRIMSLIFRSHCNCTRSLTHSPPLTAITHNSGGTEHLAQHYLLLSQYPNSSTVRPLHLRCQHT